jgi:hypothetical protein
MSNREFSADPAACARKERFPTARDAQRASNRGNSKRKVQGIYRCSCCNGYHLSAYNRKKPPPRRLDPEQEAD